MEVLGTILEMLSNKKSPQTLPNCSPEKLCLLALPSRHSSLCFLRLLHFLGSPGLSHLQVQKEMQVIVEDRNDNAPVFQNTDFSTSINEVTCALTGCVCGMQASPKSTQSGKDQRQPARHLGLGRAPPRKSSCRNQIQGLCL